MQSEKGLSAIWPQWHQNKVYPGRKRKQIRMDWLGALTKDVWRVWTCRDFLFSVKLGKDTLLMSQPLRNPQGSDLSLGCYSGNSI